MIHVIATVELHPGRRDAFLGEFQRIVPLVRAEQGCVEYGPAIDAVTDLSAQVPLGPDVVTVVEKWESLAHLKAHLVAPHMEEYRPKVRDLVIKTTLVILTPV